MGSQECRDVTDWIVLYRSNGACDSAYKEDEYGDVITTTVQCAGAEQLDY